jgi:hypothetical protein
MSKYTPGSKDWWIETALITIGGIAVAVWLWPDPSDGSRAIALSGKRPKQPRAKIRWAFFCPGGA